MNNKIGWKNPDIGRKSSEFAGTMHVVREFDPKKVHQ